MTDERAALCIDALTNLLRGGHVPRAAIACWHEHAPSDARASLRAVARRIRLGAPLDEALSCAPFDQRVIASLIACFAVHDEAGGDLARMLRGLVSSLRSSAAALQSARASAAGVVLSARLLASLPLLILLGVPSVRRQLWDPDGVLVTATGTALCLFGILWIGRLTPRRNVLRDGPAWVAELSAAVLAGGAALNEALDAVARYPPPDVAGSLRACDRRVRLGLSWPEALSRSSDRGLAELGSVVELADASGTPLAQTLVAWASDMRGRAERDFERAVRRAPVLMVVPLVLCVLPAFVLIVVTPLLRAISA